MKTQAEVIAAAIELFGCDDAEVSRPCGTYFLTLCWKRRSEGEWLKSEAPDFDYKPYNFDYTKRRCVASGATLPALWKSAKEYKRLQGMTTLEYLREKAGNPSLGATT